MHVNYFSTRQQVANWWRIYSIASQDCRREEGRGEESTSCWQNCCCSASLGCFSCFRAPNTFASLSRWRKYWHRCPAIHIYTHEWSEIKWKCINVHSEATEFVLLSNRSSGIKTCRFIKPQSFRRLGSGEIIHKVEFPPLFWGRSIS